MHEYEWADSLIDSSPRHATGFTQLIGSEPYFVSPSAWQSYSDRLKHIHDFQHICLDLFKAAIRGETDRALLHWLMNETPASLGIEYHRGLEERHFSIPQFFRTDEVRPGRIIELQCPGSLWGEMQIVSELTAMAECHDIRMPAINSLSS